MFILTKNQLYSTIYFKQAPIPSKWVWSWSISLQIMLARGADTGAVALYRYREISRHRRKYIQRVQNDFFWTFEKKKIK